MYQKKKTKFKKEIKLIKSQNSNNHTTTNRGVHHNPKPQNPIHNPRPKRHHSPLPQTLSPPPHSHPNPPPPSTLPLPIPPSPISKRRRPPFLPSRGTGQTSSFRNQSQVMEPESAIAFYIRSTLDSWWGSIYG